tara:strand:+ start:56 stop:568 length:513 start_codon:yes stop_codon:yes gene_type:complete
MTIEKKFLVNIKILFILLLLLLIYSFDYSLEWGMNLMFPKIYFFTHGVGNQGWNLFIWSENGLNETLQIILLFITLLILVKFYLNKNLLILSYLILTLSVPDLIVNKLELIDNSKLFIFNNGNFERYNLYQLFLSVITFNFVRFSELQELLFYYYFFWHTVFLKNKLKNI